jgi:hypothetical protein
MSSRPSPEDNTLLKNSDPLDRLLLRAPLIKPDAWFAARTLARCRNSQRSHSIFSFFAWNRRWAVGGVFGLFLAVFTLQQVHHSEKLISHKQRNVEEAFEVVASLGSQVDTSSGQDTTF